MLSWSTKRAFKRKYSYIASCTSSETQSSARNRFFQRKILWTIPVGSVKHYFWTLIGHKSCHFFIAAAVAAAASSASNSDSYLAANLKQAKSNFFHFFANEVTLNKDLLGHFYFSFSLFAEKFFELIIRFPVKLSFDISQIKAESSRILTKLSYLSILGEIILSKKGPKEKSIN